MLAHAPVLSTPTLRASIAPGVELTWVDDVFTTIDGKKNTAASTCDGGRRIGFFVDVLSPRGGALID